VRRMATKKVAPRRARGSIDQLPSGAYRSASTPARTHSPAQPRFDRGGSPGPTAAAEAEKVRTRFLHEIDERRNPWTRATVNQLMDRYLTVLSVGESTRPSYVSLIDNHIRTALGALQLGRVDGEVLDSFYAELRRCRRRCDGRASLLDHRVPGDHTCTDKCRPHRCRPLSQATIRKIHGVLSGALERAVRWRWIGVNPLEFAETPTPTPDPQPPSAKQAARLLTEAWKGPRPGHLPLACHDRGRTPRRAPVSWMRRRRQGSRSPIPERQAHPG
jgi:integrase